MTRNLNIPLQNGSTAVIPVPMTPKDYTYLKLIVAGLEALHVQEPPEQEAEQQAEESK